MARRNPLLERVMTLLTERGATDFRFTFGKHLKLHYRYLGQDMTTVMAISPSDHRASLNAITQVKRALREAEERAERVA